ncbi:hypothetical protein BDV25DRAFT_170817 [Aspergillus avenaceus]|uniref:Cation efflux protein transmembrane domain-containing protein n=1 Tax=Aspergillus avenaceus TaxID=36643 RepID=A0A5N6TFE3_ASPAV|nr:hypothetical protein BDV25DRAFT_170817 [Aspergillus avenaceus]
MAWLTRSGSMPQFSPSFSPAPSDSNHHSLQPRRPSLEPEGEILSTRGQRLAGLIRRRSLSVQGRSVYDGSSSREDNVARRDHSEALPWERAKQLIGDVKPVYNWQWYYRDPCTLKDMRKSVREYYERNNTLIAQYVYIDRLLDSSLPRRLIGDYQQARPDTPPENSRVNDPDPTTTDEGHEPSQRYYRIKRTPRNLYRIPSESTPLLSQEENGGIPTPPEDLPAEDDFVDSSDRIVAVAIYVNFLANVILLAAKIVAMSMTNSLSVLASLVDGALDFLSTAIVWVTTTLIRRDDRYRYPISRRRLEPLSILVFAVVMMTSFVQVAITSLSRLASPDHSLVQLTTPAIAVMASTVVVKLACWFWCRLIKSSSVQALAQDAMTDVVFNLLSILFPLIGTFTESWWIDPLGGLLLSVYIIWNWGGTASEHIQHLTGTAASPTEHSILLYMTMRFSKAILKIQNLRAYYAGDLLNVEVDIVLNGKTSLRDTHDIAESLQYMIESVPTVDRAFVHTDYDPWNIPSHMNQQET